MWLPRSLRTWLPVSAALTLALAALAACTPQVGKSCNISTDCSQLGDRLCDTNQPGGYCTVFNCEPDQCPNSICVGFDPTLDPSCGVAADGRWPRFEQSFCLAACNSNGDCRSQYDCVDLSIPANQSARSAAVVDQYAGYSPDGGLGFKVCMASTCGDGIQDGTETDVDCGGQSCYACGNSLHCLSGSDCLSGVCISNICLGGQPCFHNADCSSGVCNNADPVNGCPPATNCNCAGTNCTNGIKDPPSTGGRETDVDCGGADCARCVSTDGKLLTCLEGLDCASGNCVQQADMGRACQANNASVTCVCTPGDCHNKKWDGPTCKPNDPNKPCGDSAGDETDVDCGGGGCAPCELGLDCLVDSDCTSSNCISGTCAPPPVCSVPDAGAPWTPYDPNADAGSADAGSTDAGMDAGDGG